MTPPSTCWTVQHLTSTGRAPSKHRGAQLPGCIAAESITAALATCVCRKMVSDAEGKIRRTDVDGSNSKQKHSDWLHCQKTNIQWTAADWVVTVYMRRRCTIKPISFPDHFLLNCFRFLVLYTVYRPSHTLRGNVSTVFTATARIWENSKIWPLTKSKPLSRLLKNVTGRRGDPLCQIWCR